MVQILSMSFPIESSQWNIWPTISYKYVGNQNSNLFYIVIHCRRVGEIDYNRCGLGLQIAIQKVIVDTKRLKKY